MQKNIMEMPQRQNKPADAAMKEKDKRKMKYAGNIDNCL